MEKVLIATRKHNGEEYQFYLEKPSYKGETGILGMEIKPYISVQTPENCFGYPDYILLEKMRVYDENGKPQYVQKAYTLHRYIAPYILRKIEAQMLRFQKKFIG